MSLSQQTQAALDSLRPYERGKKKKSVPVRIKYNGEFVVLSSGKTIWRNVGHCKTAIRNHIQNSRTGQYRYNPGDEEKTFQEFMSAVQIVPVNEELLEFRQ